MPRATVWRELLTLDAAPCQIADVSVAGVYQIGGNTEPIVWGLYKPPDRGGSSPTNPTGQVHTVYLPEGCQVFAATSGVAGADTNVSLWLVWPDDDAR